MRKTLIQDFVSWHFHSIQTSVYASGDHGDGNAKDLWCNDQNTREEAEAVSYTHLDVYKRQEDRKKRHSENMKEYWRKRKEQRVKN